MDRSDSIKEITAAIAKVQGELPTIKKDKDNPISHSKYANLDSINQELLPLTSKNGLAVMQYPVTKDNKIGCGTIIMHTSGEYIHFEPYLITVAANKRMSIAQEGGATITYAKRYQISAIFGIVTDEDKDGEQPETNSSNQNGQNNQQYQNKNKSKQTNYNRNYSKKTNNSGPDPNGPLKQAQRVMDLISKQTGEPTDTMYTRILGQIGLDSSELNIFANANGFYKAVQEEQRALGGNK